MAISYKLFLDDRTQKSDNTYPLKLRVTYLRKHKFISLNVNLHTSQWNPTSEKVKSTHPNAKHITRKIHDTINEIQERALKYEATQKVYTVDDLVGNTQKSTNITFLSFAIAEIVSLKATGREGNARAYEDATKRLVQYVGNPNLRFENIDYHLLERFTTHLLTQKVKVNSIAVYMREIRALYNKAIKAEIVEAKYYPFTKYKIKTAKTINRTLTLEEMRSIVQLHLEPNTPIWEARNYFLLSFALIGMNFTDMFLLQPQNIINNRVTFSRSKTKKIYSILLHPIAKQLLTHYYNDNIEANSYLLPILLPRESPKTMKNKTKQAIKTTNKYLRRIADQCGIKSDISTYYARYSWANIAKSLGYSKDLIAEALGHEYGNRVTGIYLDNYGNDVIDNANKAVIDAVLK